MYIFSNALGSFAIDESFHIKERLLFSGEEAEKNIYLLSKGEILPQEKKLFERYKGAKKPSLQALNSILELFKKDAHLFYEADMSNTKRLVSKSVSDDLLVVQAIKTIEDIDKVANGLCKRLREWYALYAPEAEEMISDNEAFVKAVLKKTKKELLSELNIRLSMGSDLKAEDLNTIVLLAGTIGGLYERRKAIEEYIGHVMKKLCPNFFELAGSNIGAKMMAKAGSIEKMAFMPSSTIQLLGAEEALFRHIKTGARPPKYGILLQHPLVQKAKKKEKGRVAKALADKMSIAVKVDFFKGEFVGKKLKDDLERKFG